MLEMSDDRFQLVLNTEYRVTAEGWHEHCNRAYSMCVVF